jgi:hypothetical protein
MLEKTARQLLIDSCYSSREAAEELLKNLASPAFVSLLVKIALDEDDHEGDAPMQAAYYLSKAPVDLTRPFESQLLRLLPVARTRERDVVAPVAQRFLRYDRYFWNF